MANQITYVVCIPGTSENKVPGGNAKAYWESKTGIKATTCSCVNCNSKADDGSHVVRAEQLPNGEWVYNSDGQQYIVPMCHECNEQEGKLMCVNAKLVPVS